MKYFRVRNDIIKTDSEGNPTVTDEPRWLRETIDTWKTGGRFFATEDARYSIIISPNDDLMELSQNDLEEISEEECLEYIDQAFPPQIISRENEPDEIIPTPSLEKVCSIYWKYATNHTGTIAVDDTWTLADNDHHITGNITINSNVRLQIDPGVNVYYEGNYSITMTAGSGSTTKIIAIGTSTNRIKFEANSSRTNTAMYNTITTIFTAANNSVVTFQYCDFANANNCVVVSGYSDCIVTLDYLTIRDCTNFCVNVNGPIVPSTNISNSRFTRTYGSALSFGTVTAAGGTHTFSDCMFSACVQVAIATVTTGSLTVVFNDCMFIDRTVLSPAGGNTMSICTYNFNRCFIDCSYMQLGSGVTTPTICTLVDCILIRSPLVAGVYTTSTICLSDQSITTCDFMSGSGTTSFAVTSGSTLAKTITLTSCYISGFRGVDYLNYYTGTETPAQTNVAAGGLLVHATPRTTRNFPFTQSSISSSVVGVNSVTVSWTGAFKTRNRVRYGTSSGTYTMVVEAPGGWTGFDGNGVYVKSPSIALVNLKEGTTYYYVCESWDWVLGLWQTSVEGTFVTPGSSAPTFAGITGLENVGFGALLVSWSVSTGTTTNYNIYIKIGSAPTFSEKPIKVDTSYLSFKLTHLSDGTRLTDSDNVYVSVRAENTPSLIDTNTVVLNEYVQGSGSVGVIVGDTVALSLKG